MKKFLALLSAAALLFGFTACGGVPADPYDNIDEEVLSVNSFILSEKTVKPLGRTEFKDDTLWLAYSGSGAEFTFNGTRCAVTMAGDDNIFSEDVNNRPRIAIFVDGVRAIDEQLSLPEVSYAVVEEETAGEHTVRIVKLSETGNSTCAIKSVEVEAYGRIRPTAEKEHSIEFIGDSITCGYGVDAKSEYESFSTSTEDCTLAYAYLTAQLLDVDYSLVSKSGHGIITGYTGDGTKQTWGIMSDYYEKFGSGNGRYLDTYPDNVEWNFKKARKNDVVVINLGTNDYSYTGNDAARCGEYKDGYVAFLKTVRKRNPDALIICALGIMGDGLYPSVEAAVEEYKAAEKDDNVTAFHFEPQNAKDGYGADWHPSAVTHRLAAEKLAEFIREQMDW